MLFDAYNFIRISDCTFLFLSVVIIEIATAQMRINCKRKRQKFASILYIADVQSVLCFFYFDNFDFIFNFLVKPDAKKNFGIIKTLLHAFLETPCTTRCNVRTASAKESHREVRLDDRTATD